MTNKLIKQSMVLSIISICFALFFWSCDIYEDEKFNISELDANGCALLQETAADTVTTVNIALYDTTWTGTNIRNKVNEILTYLESEEIKLTVGDGSNYLLMTPAAVDTAYFSFDSDLTGVVFYMNDFVAVNLIGTDGTVLSQKKGTLDPETILVATLTDTTDWKNTCLELKNRVVYVLDTNKKLLQIIKTDQAKNNNFRFVFLSN